MIGTVCVPLSFEFSTTAAGFNRFLGFGIILHNMAEFIIIAVLWNGTNTYNSIKKVFKIYIIYN